MTRREIVKYQAFDDAIGWCGDENVYKAFQVPYRQLVPTKVDNLLVAGRCLGAPDSIDTLRLIGPCFMTGQAAGVAAALSAAKGVAPRALDAKVLQKSLQAQGVYLG